MSLKEYLFGSLDEVAVVIDPEKVDKALGIFAKYSVKAILRENVEKSCQGPVKVLEFGSKHPNKILLMHLVDHSNFLNLFNELYEADIAGNSRHNAVNSSPYSLKRKLEELLKDVRGYFQRPA